MRLDGDAYYLSLFTFQGLAPKTSYNPLFGPKVLTALVLNGFVVFYVVSFFRHPGKLLRVLGDLLTMRSGSKTGRAAKGMLGQLIRGWSFGTSGER